MATKALEIPISAVDRITKPLERMDKRFQRFGKSAEKAVSGVNKRFDVMNAAVGRAQNALRGLITFIVARFTLNAIKGIAETTDALGKLAESTGDTVENLSSLEKAFSFAGIEGSRFRPIMTRVFQLLREAQDPASKIGERIRSLGIDLGEFTQKGNVERLRELARGLEDLSASDRRAFLSLVFPEAGVDLARVIGTGRESFEEQLEQGRRYGEITRDQSEAAARLNDELEKLSSSFDELGRIVLPLAADVARLVTQLVEGTSSVVLALQELGILSEIGFTGTGQGRTETGLVTDSLTDAQFARAVQRAREGLPPPGQGGALFDVDRSIYRDLPTLAGSDALAFIDQIEPQATALESAFERVRDLALDVGRSAVPLIADGIADAIEGTRSWNDALKGILQSILQIALRLAITRAITSAFPILAEKGMVLGNGQRPIPFATGGVIGGPILFPLAGGRTGLAGEAGPEAILPLKPVGGELGVKADVGRTGVVNYYIQAWDGADVERVLSQRVARQAVARGIRQSMVEDRTFRRSLLPSGGPRA